MRHVVSCFLYAALTLTAPAFAAGEDHAHDAGGGHSHATISDSEATAKATQKIVELISNGKLDKSWSGIAAAKTEQKDFGKGKEWVVSFANTAVADATKQTLYVFLDASGHYLAANYSGK